jgi:hypothetical protein
MLNPREGVDDVEKSLCPCRELNTHSPVSKSVTLRHIGKEAIKLYGKKLVTSVILKS